MTFIAAHFDVSLLHDMRENKTSNKTGQLSFLKKEGSTLRSGHKKRFKSMQ